VFEGPQHPLGSVPADLRRVCDIGGGDVGARSQHCEHLRWIAAPQIRDTRRRLLPPVCDAVQFAKGRYCTALHLRNPQAQHIEGRTAASPRLARRGQGDKAEGPVFLRRDAGGHHGPVQTFAFARYVKEPPCPKRRAALRDGVQARRAVKGLLPGVLHVVEGGVRGHAIREHRIPLPHRSMSPQKPPQVGRHTRRCGQPTQCPSGAFQIPDAIRIAARVQLRAADAVPVKPASLRAEHGLDLTIGKALGRPLPHPSHRLVQPAHGLRGACEIGGQRRFRPPPRIDIEEITSTDTGQREVPDGDAFRRIRILFHVVRRIIGRRQRPTRIVVGPVVIIRVVVHIGRLRYICGLPKRFPFAFMGHDKYPLSRVLLYRERHGKILVQDRDRTTAMPSLPSSSCLVSVLPEMSEELTELYRRGTPANTLRAWERDLVYIRAWKQLTFGTDMTWPEEERVALRFLLDHSTALHDPSHPAQGVALALIGLGLRRSLACPAPATLDRRIASWRSFHRMRNLASPFDAPAVSAARSKARRAADRPRKPKSAKPVTREVLETLLATCDYTARGIRDRAMLMLAFASGGRRRSEVTALDIEDVGADEFKTKGVIWLRLLETKTTARALAPRLPLKGRAATALLDWLKVRPAGPGPLFRPVSTADRVLARRLAPDALRIILRHRLTQAGLPVDYASPHGLRAGFLTQAALDGVPLAAAMKLSLHSSAVQAQRYYADVDVEMNPATELLG